MTAMIPDTFDDMRKAMVVSQLRTNAVTDPRVIDAMAQVPREDFVPTDRRATVYSDIIVPFGDGLFLNPPMVTGRLLNEAQIEPGDRVLIVGSATQYVAAIVAMLTDHVESAPGSGDDANGPYDVIVIDGAAEDVPENLIAKLAPAGRLVTGIVESGVTRLAVGRRGGAGFGLVTFADADVAVLPAFARPAAFVF